MREWNVDFGSMKMVEVAQMRIRWGRLNLDDLFADIAEELTTPIPWDGNRVVLPEYAPRAIEKFLTKTLYSEEIMMRLLYGEEETDMEDHIQYIARMFTHSLETNKMFLENGRSKLIKRLNDVADPLHIKMFDIGKPFYRSVDPSWAIRKLLNIAKRNESLAMNYDAAALEAFNAGVRDLLPFELKGPELERAKLALFGYCDALWADEKGRILGFFDSDFINGNWVQPIDIETPAARRILWELRGSCAAILR